MLANQQPKVLAAGERLSEICAGKSLTQLRVEERDGVVYLIDKRARLAV